MLLCPITVCVGAYLVEWVNHEIALQRWLNGNLRRIDFYGIYSSVGKERLREALLIALPRGTPEEQLKEFYLANVKTGQGVLKPEKYSEENLIFIETYESISGHGHFAERILGVG